jgi:hypothetical protein
MRSSATPSNAIRTSRGGSKPRRSTPAEVANKPKKPIAQALAGLSLPIAAFLALLIGTALDLFKGRLVETWQVRRRLKTEVLGELELPG